jgi:predicted RNA-binding protein
MPSYWVLSGTLENWRVALEKGVWGVGERARGLWARVQPGDIVVFYATRAGVLGYGVVEGKFEGSEPLWPREREEGKVVWPYRLKIRVEKVFDKPKPRPKNMLVAFAINKLDEKAFRELLS